ncbi:MAG: hypothetical protein OHK0038_00150 [Flammeovirgaceae bacterium]
MKLYIKLLLITAIFTFFGEKTVYAQKKKSTTPTIRTKADTRHPHVDEEILKRSEKRAKKSKKEIIVAETENTFSDRRHDEYTHRTEEIDKPRYSNKMYFGHRKPPKKRPPHKRKLCKECGLKH